MFPWNYGFHWTAGTIIFLGAFYTVLTIVFATLGRAAWRSWRDMRLEKAESIRWISDFHDLPAGDRGCRHELTGEVRQRKCPNAFDCRICDTHPAFLARNPPPEMDSSSSGTDIYGLPFPADRLYHRGHTWAKPEPDGTVTIGLDEIGRRLIGRPDRLELPEAGRRIHANGAAWRAERRGAAVRILSPVDGKVVATGGSEQEWYLRVKPVDGGMDTRHLLRPHELKPWVMRELERLQIALGGGRLSLADGGVPVADIASAYSGDDWDAVCGEMFLQP